MFYYVSFCHAVCRADAANRNQLIVYIRFIDPTTFKIREEFLGIVSLPAGDAETIDTALRDYLLHNGLSLSNCVAFGSDGAGTMVGSKKGVSTRIKQRVPYTISTHCNSHRFALVAGDAAKVVPYLNDTFSGLLISLWAYLHFSTSRWSRLQAYWKQYQVYVTAEAYVCNHVFDILFIEFFCPCRLKP
jgi:hypothetical protein